MPNRIIRESILTSDRVDQLDPSAEVFYRRLLSKVDDYGRYDARPSILRASLFPLRLDRVREADCSRWIAACEKAGLIVLYSNAGKLFLEAQDTEWQRRSPSKYPDPLTSANICAQVKTNARLVVDVDVGVDDEKQGAPPSAEPAAEKADKGKNGTRLPADWSPSDELKAWAAKKRPDLDIAEQVEKFADFWRAMPGARGRKTDWDATWRNWIRGERKAFDSDKPTNPAVPRGKPSGPSETPLEAQLNWIAQTVRGGGMTSEEAELARAAATEKHRRRA